MGQLFCPNKECAVLSFETMFYPDEIYRQCPNCQTQAIEISIHGGVITNVSSTVNEPVRRNEFDSVDNIRRARR